MCQPHRWMYYGNALQWKCHSKKRTTIIIIIELYTIPAHDDERSIENFNKRLTQFFHSSARWYAQKPAWTMVLMELKYIIKGTIAGFRKIGEDESQERLGGRKQKKNESDDRKLPFDIWYCYFHWGKKMHSKKKHWKPLKRFKRSFHRISS